MRTAAYARYSSDQQSASSIDDQLRNVRAYCERQGWPAPQVYQDAAISGARNDRPGYRALLAAASGFDVILVDDLSRLARDSIEVAQAVRRLTFAGVRLIGVSDGVDTGRKSHKADVGLRGLMGELYLDDLRDKTHRGLSGRALAGASAGGLPYGYRVTERGQRAIDLQQAEVVRRIYRAYLDGHSARQIAAQLNADGVPSPRGSTWAASAIHGDARRGIGILVNPIYTGRQTWNRSRWIKHPDTGRRVRQERPESEWITTEQPELAIIDPATWAAVQARLGGRQCGDKGQAKRSAGRPPAHLLSGLLRCGECGGPMVIVDRYRYGCATAKDRGTCTSKLHVRRDDAEHALLATIREQLLTEQSYRRYLAAVQRALKDSAPDTTTIERKLAAARKAQANVMAAIRAGIITPSTKAELLSAEAEITAAERELAAARSHQPSQVMPRARERWHSIVARLADVNRDLPAARQAIRELLGQNIPVRQHNGQPVAELAACQTIVVAGAGFEPATFGL
jgi:site-specific DNA recombinase